VITDVCLCEYTDPWPCGVVEMAMWPIDSTWRVLLAGALARARGRGHRRPSDMMDGRVGPFVKRWMNTESCIRLIRLALLLKRLTVAVWLTRIYQLRSPMRRRAFESRKWSTPDDSRRVHPAFTNGPTRPSSCLTGRRCPRRARVRERLLSKNRHRGVIGHIAIFDHRHNGHGPCIAEADVGNHKSFNFALRIASMARWTTP